MTAVSMTELLERLTESVESADPPLRLRPEWKDLESFCRNLDRGDSPAMAPEDLVREAEAKIDLLELARAEVDMGREIEEEARSARLREDERLLEALGDEGKVYVGLIAASLFFPPLLLLMPFGALLILGVVPALFGFARMRAAEQPTIGRVWLVLQDRVDGVLGRVRLLHGAAITSLLLTGVWTLVEIFSAELGNR